MQNCQSLLSSRFGTGLRSTGGRWGVHLFRGRRVSHAAETKDSGGRYSNAASARRWLVGLALATVHGLGGCCNSKECQLERVAKDWCYTIRASQVIPVYPLTEDLQPGDIFLVQVPIEEQQRIYREGGFLPLDNHLDRLDPDGYELFYSHSFDLGDEKLPQAWLARDADGKSAWKGAPNASFPTYSFSTSRGGGLSVALPVQGVPVGLSLLGSEAANGSISIKQAKTIGVDTRSLYAQLTTWAALHRDFLRNFGPPPGRSPSNYLRVVTRIYATGKMDVFLSSASSYAGGADVGVPKPIDLLAPKLPTDRESTDSTNRENYAENIKAINSTIAEASKLGMQDGVQKVLPGGSVRLMAATARTVSLSETFDTPLVLGYLGFDCTILKGGILGPPISTHAVIDPDRYGVNTPSATPAEVSVTRRLNSAAYDVLVTLASKPGNARGREAASIKSRLDALAKAIPAKPRSYRRQVASDFVLVDLVDASLVEADPAERTYRTFLSYREAIETADRMLAGLSKSSLSDEQSHRVSAAMSETDEALFELQEKRLQAREHAAATDAIAFILELNQ